MSQEPDQGVGLPCEQLESNPAASSRHPDDGNPALSTARRSRKNGRRISPTRKKDGRRVGENIPGFESPQKKHSRSTKKLLGVVFVSLALEFISQQLSCTYLF